MKRDEAEVFFRLVMNDFEIHESDIEKALDSGEFQMSQMEDNGILRLEVADSSTRLALKISLQEAGYFLLGGVRQEPIYFALPAVRVCGSCDAPCPIDANTPCLSCGKDERVLKYIENNNPELPEMLEGPIAIHIL